MQTQEFNKLMEFQDAKWADIQKLMWAKPTTPTQGNIVSEEQKAEMREEIQKHEEPIPAEIQTTVHRFIEEQKKLGTKNRTIRRMVQRKWNIKVV